METAPSQKNMAASCGPAPEKPCWTWPVTRLAEYTSLPESGGEFFPDEGFILPGPWTREALQHMSDPSQSKPADVPGEGECFPPENCNDVYCVRFEFYKVLEKQFGQSACYAVARLDSLQTQNPLLTTLICSQETSFAADVIEAFKNEDTPPINDCDFHVLLDRTLPIREAYSRLHATATHKLQHVVSQRGQMLDLDTPLQAYMADEASGVQEGHILFVQYKL